MIDKTQFPKFFAAHRRACLALCLDTDEAKDAYYRKVCFEVAKVDSVKSIETQRDFDLCLARFAHDAGLVSVRFDANYEKQKRCAYVARVMADQIMQIERISGAAGYDYIRGILNQSKLPRSYPANGEDFWMDLSYQTIITCIKILDTHLRRLKSRLLPVLPLAFDAGLRFEWNGEKLTAVPVGKYYYW